MWNQYPPPSYAAYIWTQGGNKLFVAFPGEKSGHKVAVEFDLPSLRGLASAPELSLLERKSIGALFGILQTLIAREHNESASIGTLAAPTQHDLDLILKALKARPAKKVPEKLTIEDLQL